MKAFILSTVFAIALAVGAGMVLPNYASRNAADAFSTASARVSPDGSAAERGWQWW